MTAIRSPPGRGAADAADLRQCRRPRPFQDPEDPAARGRDFTTPTLPTRRTWRSSTRRWPAVLAWAERGRPAAAAPRRGRVTARRARGRRRRPRQQVRHIGEEPRAFMYRPLAQEYAPQRHADGARRGCASSRCDRGPQAGSPGHSMAVLRCSACRRWTRRSRSRCCRCVLRADCSAPSGCSRWYWRRLASTACCRSSFARGRVRSAFEWRLGATPRTRGRPGGEAGDGLDAQRDGDRSRAGAGRVTRCSDRCSTASARRTR